MLLRQYDYNNLLSMIEPVFNYRNVEEMLSQYPGVEVTFKNGKKIYFFYNIDAYHLVGPVDADLRDFSKSGMRVIKDTWEGYERYENRYHEAINDFCDRANKYIKEGNATVVLNYVPDVTIRSTMKHITKVEELEARRQYWAHLKNSSIKDIDMLFCLPWRGSIAVSFYVAEFMDGVKDASWILNNYDVIGPIPPLSSSDFQSHIDNKEEK